MPITRIARPQTMTALHGTTTPRTKIDGPRHDAALARGDRVDGNGAETHWQQSIGGRQVIPTPVEVARAARQVAAQFGGSRGTDSIAARRTAIDLGQNRYDAAFERAARIGPLGAKMLKSQDYQESNLIGDAPGGGIGQMDAEVAAKYGVTNIGDPSQTIPAQAAYERDTAKSLGAAYARYGGDPKSPEFAKFILGAYNAGMTTVADAMRLAHDHALAHAKKSGASDSDARSAASHAATTWNALFDAGAGKTRSPFYRAASVDLPVDPAAKYDITKSYVDEILTRAKQ